MRPAATEFKGSSIEHDKFPFDFPQLSPGPQQLQDQASHLTSGHASDTPSPPSRLACVCGFAFCCGALGFTGRQWSEFVNVPYLLIREHKVCISGLTSAAISPRQVCVCNQAEHLPHVTHI